MDWQIHERKLYVNEKGHQILSAIFPAVTEQNWSGTEWSEMIGDHTFLHIITCLMDARKSLYACHSLCTWTGWTLAYSLIN